MVEESGGCNVYNKELKGISGKGAVVRYERRGWIIVCVVHSTLQQFYSAQYSRLLL